MTADTPLPFDTKLRIGHGHARHIEDWWWDRFLQDAFESDETCIFEGYEYGEDIDRLLLGMVEHVRRNTSRLSEYAFFAPADVIRSVTNYWPFQHYLNLQSHRGRDRWMLRSHGESTPFIPVSALEPRMLILAPESIAGEQRWPINGPTALAVNVHAKLTYSFRIDGTGRLAVEEVLG